VTYFDLVTDELL